MWESFSSFHGADPAFILAWSRASISEQSVLFEQELPLFCLLHDRWDTDITALGMSSAVSPTKEKVWVKCWAGSDHGAFTENKTHLIWIKSFLTSFRQQSSDRGCRTQFYFLSVIPEVWRHKSQIWLTHSSAQHKKQNFVQGTRVKPWFEGPFM